MKNLVIIFFSLLLFSCGNESIVIDNVQTNVIEIDNKRDFLDQTGYIKLIMNKSDSKAFIENYNITTEKYKGHKFLNQYRLEVIQYLIKNTDFLSEIDKTNSDYLMDMYLGFQTKGGLEIKYKMLNKLSEFFPESKINELKNIAYLQGHEYKIYVNERLNSYEDLISGRELNEVEKMTLQAKQNRVNDANTYLNYFKIES